MFAYFLVPFPCLCAQKTGSRPPSPPPLEYKRGLCNVCTIESNEIVWQCESSDKHSVCKECFPNLPLIKDMSSWRKNHTCPFACKSEINLLQFLDVTETVIDRDMRDNLEHFVKKAMREDSAGKTKP